MNRNGTHVDQETATFFVFDFVVLSYSLLQMVVGAQTLLSFCKLNGLVSESITLPSASLATKGTKSLQEKLS